MPDTKERRGYKGEHQFFKGEDYDFVRCDDTDGTEQEDSESWLKFKAYLVGNGDQCVARVSTSQNSKATRLEALLVNGSLVPLPQGILFNSQRDAATALFVLRAYTTLLQESSHAEGCRPNEATRTNRDLRGRGARNRSDQLPGAGLPKSS